MKKIIIICLAYSIFAMNVLCDDLGLVEFSVQNSLNDDLSMNITDNTTLAVDDGNKESSNATIEKQSNNEICIVMKKNTFPEQNIRVKKTSSREVIFDLKVKRDHADNPPIVTISNAEGSDNVKSSLYRSITGGGNSFVVAVGNTANDVSIASIKKQQAHGEMQVYLKVE
jgi:hypothetical protein